MKQIRFWHVLAAAIAAVMLTAAVAPPPILRQILTTNSLAAGNAGEFLSRVGVDGIAFAALPQNGSANNGVVLAGGANFNTVWKTDGAGNPAWRAESGSGAYIASINGLGSNTTFYPAIAGSNLPPVKINMSSTTNGLEFYDVNGNLVMCVTTNGRVLLPNGTNNFPAIGWISEEDGTGTGFYRTAATLNISANGGRTVRVSNGEFGIVDSSSLAWTTGGSANVSAVQESVGTLRWHSTLNAWTNRIFSLYTPTNANYYELGYSTDLGWFFLRSNTNSTSSTTAATNKPVAISVRATSIPEILITTNSTVNVLATNGLTVSKEIYATNGVVSMGAASSIANITITTNSTQIWCLNGTNQLVTLPDCTKIPSYQIFRFSSTNGYGSVVITNATGAQTIRDSVSLDYKVNGVFSVAFFTDGAAWWIASKAKTIWPNASWSSTTNVPFAVATSNYITFDQLETSNGQGITLTNGYQVYVKDAGQYLITFSVVMQVGHNNDTNRVWLQQSGQNVPRTRTDVKLTSTSEQNVMTVNFIMPVVTNLTWFALCLRSTDTGASLVSGATADATMPAMPPAIITVNKISDTFP